MNTESNARQAGFQTNRVPWHARTVLVLLDEPGMEVWLAFYGDRKWRSLNRGLLKYKVLGWIELSDAAHYLNAIGNPSDS